ncbi:hypothetical protein ACHAQJ_010672 [Trichoderma viride]
MAELEMDVDLAPPMKFDEHVDEDLIDYDIDTTEDHTHEPWSSHQDEHTSSVPEHVHSAGVLVGTDPKYTEAGQTEENFRDAEADHPHGDEDYEHHAIEESHGQSQVSAQTHEDKDDVLETEQSKDLNEADGNEDVGNVIVAEAEDAVDEIDYEDDDVAVTQESLNKPEEKEGSVHVVGSNDGMVAAEDVASTTTAEPASLALPIEAPAGSSDVPEPAAKDDEDEITWEHEDEDDAEKHDETKSTAGFVETVAVETVAVETVDVETVDVETVATEIVAAETIIGPDHTETEPTQNSDSHDQVYEQHTNATDSDYEDNAMEASEEKASSAYQQDELLSQPEELNSEAPDFPAITVQYKGDEFPFFSQDKTEGFFSDSSVLDLSMESVLVGFRAELENEIAAQDELVFQVDELGLEFAETTAQDSLATVTLRQVLEVFDLLVKNQDPDSSRTLYTYLFTRSNASKRFEFLAESATAGRGLDEVIHLFESPAGHHHHIIAETEDEHEHDHDEDSEANEATETHESAEDDDENDDVDVDTEESEASEEEEEEEEEDEETSVAEEQPVETANRYEEEEQVGEEEDEEDEEEEDDFMAENEDFIGDVEGSVNQEGDYSDGAEESYKDEQLQPVVVEPVNHSGHADATADAENAPDATYSYGKVTPMCTPRLFVRSNTNQLGEDDEDEDADANPFIHLEMQESMVDDGGEIEYEEMAHVEVGNDESRQMAMHSIDEYIDTNEADTGTTNTLVDNGEAISTLLDISADQGLDEEVTNEDLAFDDEVPEIDWRDDLDAPDDAKNEMPTTPSGLSKRPRTEDEQGVEDEQDVKRRRP